MNIKPILSFLFGTHKLITSVVLTAAVCTSGAATISTVVAKTKHATVSSQVSSTTSSSEILSSSSEITPSSEPVSSTISSSTPASSTAPTQSTTSYVHGQKQGEYIASQKQQVSSTPSQVQQTIPSSKPDINKSDYAITVRHDIDIYQSRVNEDTATLNEKKSNLQEVENDLSVITVNSNGKLVQIADPQKVNNSQDEVAVAQSALDSDQKELQYWQDIAKNDGITY